MITCMYVNIHDFILPLGNGETNGKRQTSIKCGLPANAAHSKEFDPLSSQRAVEENTQNKVMSSFGLSTDGKFHFISSKFLISFLIFVLFKKIIIPFFNFCCFRNYIFQSLERFPSFLIFDHFNTCTV